MNTNANTTELLGKKIFFLYPSTVVQNMIITELIQQEYEVYETKDHAALRRVLKRYPDSIVFAHINEQMPEREWEAWIRGLVNDPETKNTMIGVISASADEALQQKYLNAIKVQCGFTVLKSDLNSSIKQICGKLIAANAKGRRKFLRTITGNETNATINLPMNGTYINGTIKDISTAGISCAFGKDPVLKKNALFKDIQIKLQSVLLRVEAIVLGSRADTDGTEATYILLFTPKVDPETKTKIRKYIHQNLQTKMDAELK